MTPAERAKWCIAQAEELERDLDATDDEVIQIGAMFASWYRAAAFALTERGGSRSLQ